MFGFTKSAKSTAIVLGAALAVSAGLASAASAVPAPMRAGNSFEVPLATGGGCQGGSTYLMQMPEGNTVPMACPGTMHEASTAFYSGPQARHERIAAPKLAASTNPMMTCVGGYTWRYKHAGEWDTLPIRCGG